jgi:hypothetical protein
MKAVLAALLFAAAATAQINPALAQAQAACGPLDVRFDAKTFASLPTAGPENGKALVYEEMIVHKAVRSHQALGPRQGAVGSGQHPAFLPALFLPRRAWRGGSRGSGLTHHSMGDSLEICGWC